MARGQESGRHERGVDGRSHFPGNNTASMFAQHIMGKGFMFPFSQRERLVVSYIWIIASRLVGIYVVSYVLRHVTDRTEVVIVTVAGMLYGVLSWLMYSQQFSTYRLSRQIIKRVRRKRDLVDPNVPDDEDEFGYGLIIDGPDYAHNKRRIDLVSLASMVVAGMCFQRFASVLPFSIL
jgi:hypothetical protein